MRAQNHDGWVIIKSVRERGVLAPILWAPLSGALLAMPSGRKRRDDLWLWRAAEGLVDFDFQIPRIKLRFDRFSPRSDQALRKKCFLLGFAWELT